MDKGIRPAANAKFNELLPTRAEVGNTAFRKAVLFYIVEEFGTTLAAAATHYNHAFQNVKAARPDLVEGLGRPEGKNNGGRKRKVAETAAEIMAEVLLLGYTPAAEFADAEFAEPEGFTVKRKRDGAVIADNVSFDEAHELVDKAKAAKKATLYYV
jgi:hypothetical protein